MEVALLTIAGLSLLLSVAMGSALLAVLRQSRARADARVALLRAAASTTHTAEDLDNAEDRDPGGEAQEAGALFSATLVAERDGPAIWPRRAGIAAALLVVLFGGFRLLAGPGGPPEWAGPTGRTLPLELVELEHETGRGSLTVSGTVRNPRASATLEHIVAVATVIGSGGAVAGIARAGLDHSVLRPGEESLFVINVPLSGGVSRYRVGFRRRDGAVVAHVDRRSRTAAVHNQRTTGGEPWVP